MKINANQITALRIILLPLPLFLFYGGTTSRFIALVILIFLGLTDYLDGLMARKYGVTTLGKLLDPIADKIFVAVTLVPLADLHILPMWIVWPIFLREFLVTEMRRFMPPGTEGLKVTELAKIKTTLQMVGVGLILLTATFPDKLITISFLAGLFVATLFLGVAIYFKTSQLSSRLKTALLFETVGLVIAMTFPASKTNLLYGVIVLGITLISGFQYVKACLPSTLQAGWNAFFHLVSALALPLFVLGLLPVAPRNTHLLVVLILAVEFAVQGIDMWAAQEKKRDISEIKKRYLVPSLLLISGLLLIVGVDMVSVALWFLALASVASLFYLAADIWLHRELFSNGEFF
jgi:CDP-diacylglycerol--glycerol-3-phosphate 3-phosphatidyltransferase